MNLSRGYELNVVLSPTAKRFSRVLGIAQQLGGESPLPDLMEVKG
jgi:hypothetical protein